MIGTSYHNMDAKGRLAMPAKLREALGATFYISIGQGASLVVYSPEDWEVKKAKARALPSSKLSRLLPFFTSAVLCEPDGQGRILLSPELREHANLKKEVAVLGAVDHVELRDADTWRAEYKRRMDTNDVFAAMEEYDF